MRYLLAFFVISTSVFAQVLDTQRVLEQQQVSAIEDAFTHGYYQRCADACQYIIMQKAKSPEFHVVLIRSLMATGQGMDALKACEEARKAHPTDLQVIMEHYDTLMRLGKKAEAAKALTAINDAARAKPAKDRTAMDLVVLARAALAAGADAQKVLQQYLAVAKKKDPKSEQVYLTLGNLALDHSDLARAATEFRAGLKEHGESPELRFGLARAFAPSDRAKSLEQIERVLETNEHHVGALVLKGEHFIGAEKFDDADAVLQSAISTNIASAEAWALRSVIASLSANDPAKATEYRSKALEAWAQNPMVDHLIGKCLSRAYRFAEGAQQQREVLALDPAFLPAKLQLSSDLMRLGETAEAWKLAAEIREADGFNTQAHNLGLLEKEMETYHVEKQPDFILRMTDRDWQIYGSNALALLRDAQTKLGQKYAHNFDKPTLVEFFPSQQDFAIRTFGALGGQGLLGVCFGTVITMNSPGSLAHGRSNWESTLWHEFCHVVTLSVTHNRMPRWLSEGISVYEETERDPSWGMKMNETYRKMIIEDSALTPLSQMSSAFMKADSNDAILFAYYESSMAVRWMIAKHGWEKFRAVLGELAAGTRINAALEKHLDDIDKMESEFTGFMIDQANGYAPKADWSKPEGKLADFLKAHPNNLIALRQQADDLLEAKQWDKAMAVGQQLIELEPDNTSADSGYWIKGKALHQLGKLDEEAQTLRVMAAKSSDALAVFMRLLEIDQGQKQWQLAQTDADRVFALNPFLPQASEALALAAEATAKPADAVGHYDRLLALQPANPAQVRYKLATLLKATDAGKAKRHVLEALLIAPRYRDAQSLLLELQPNK